MTTQAYSRVNPQTGQTEYIDPRTGQYNPYKTVSEQTYNTPGSNYMTDPIYVYGDQDYIGNAGRKDVWGNPAPLDPTWGVPDTERGVTSGMTNQEKWARIDALGQSFRPTSAQNAIFYGEGGRQTFLNSNNELLDANNTVIGKYDPNTHQITANGQVIATLDPASRTFTSVYGAGGIYQSPLGAQSPVVGGAPSATPPVGTGASANIQSGGGQPPANPNIQPVGGAAPNVNASQQLPPNSSNFNWNSAPSGISYVGYFYNPQSGQYAFRGNNGGLYTSNGDQYGWISAQPNADGTYNLVGMDQVSVIGTYNPQTQQFTSIYGSGGSYYPHSLVYGGNNPVVREPGEATSDYWYSEENPLEGLGGLPPAPSFPFEMTVPTTSAEMDYFTSVQRTIEPYLKALTEAFGGEPTYEVGPEWAENYFEKAVKPGLVKEWEETVLPQLKESYAGPNYWGSARAEAERKSSEDLGLELMRQKADLQYKEELARRQAYEYALNRQAQLEPTDIANIQGMAGAYSRQIEEKKVQEELTRWLSGEEVGGTWAPQYNPFIPIAMSLMGLTPYQVAGSTSSGGTSPWQSLLGLGGQLGSAAIIASAL